MRIKAKKKHCMMKETEAKHSKTKAPTRTYEIAVKPGSPVNTYNKKEENEDEDEEDDEDLAIEVEVKKHKEIKSEPTSTSTTPQTVVSTIHSPPPAPPLPIVPQITHNLVIYPVIKKTNLFENKPLILAGHTDYITSISFVHSALFAEQSKKILVL